MDMETAAASAKTSVYLNAHRRAFCAMNNLTAQDVLDAGFEYLEREGRMRPGGPGDDGPSGRAQYVTYRSGLPGWDELSDDERRHWRRVAGAGRE